MSLFKAREFWTTQCGSDETFDQSSVTVASIEGVSESVIVGGHSGNLRIYQPSTLKQEDGKFVGYKPSDLLIEVQLQYPILQVCTGKLVSGSQNIQIGILHQQNVAVYSLLTRRGATEHGDERSLVLAYEHQLRRTAFCMVIGSFGGARNRDFICVQSLDGSLCFFEQETFSFIQFIPNFLLPGPLVFLSHTDSFLTVSSNLHVESYRYQELAETSRNNDQNVQEGKKLVPDWTYNIGEAAMDVSKVTWASHSDILILGERNIYCITEKGSLKFMKRLEYKPLCFLPYKAESSGKLMILVASEMCTLLIYEQITLRWSCQINFPPVAVLRVNLQNLNGVLTLLSEDGLLQCSYLGTDPSLFIPPPLEATQIDYQEAGKELLDLQRIISSYSKVNSDVLASSAYEHEVDVVVNIGPHAEPGSSGTMMSMPSCQVNVKLQPHVPLNKVQVAIIVQPPLKASHFTHTVSSLCEPLQVGTDVHLTEPGDVPSLEIRVVTSYITNSRNIPRVLQHFAQLPLKLVVKACSPKQEAEFKITINSNKPVVNLSQLFGEFSWEDTSDSSIGFSSSTSENCTVIILAIKAAQCYQLQSDTFASLCLLTHHLVNRLKKHFAKEKDFCCYYNSPLPLQELCDALDKRFKCRRDSFKLKDDLGQKAAQFRIIQRRLLTKMKDKTPTPINNLECLLKDTYEKILVSTEQLEKNQNTMKYLNIQLSCCILLLLFLFDLTTSSAEKHVGELKAALNFSVNDFEDQGWDEITNAAISYLLRTSLAKSSKDQQRSAPISLAPLHDTERFKKHILAVFDRVYKSSQFVEKRVPTAELGFLHMGISPIPEISEAPLDEGEGVIPQGSQLAEKKLSALAHGRTTGLLRARHSLRNSQPSAGEMMHGNVDEKQPTVDYFKIKALDEDKPPPDPLKNITVQSKIDSPEEVDDIW